MRKFTILFLLMVSLAACAQNDKYFNVNSKVLIFKDPPLAKDKPLVLIDDKEYKGKLEDINQDDIIAVSIIKTADGAKIYGKKGANGVVMITTKQSLPSTQDNIILPPPPHGKKRPDKFIVDGKDRGEMKLEEVDALQVLKFEAARLPKDTGIDSLGTLYTITTKGFAIMQYQKKLGAFSKEYKAYFDSCRCNDIRFLYVLNGKPLKQEEDNRTVEKLYDLPAESITSVMFMDKHYKNALDNKEPVVVITTK